MADKKRAFTLSDRERTAMATDKRAANALEFIAHYLDRIDSHLERLADTAEKSASKGEWKGVAPIGPRRS